MDHSGLFEQRPGLLRLTLLVLLILGLGIRVYFINAPGIAPDREYRSALLARAYYFESNESIEEWRKQIAAAIVRQNPILEPPITEIVASWGYRVAGGEHLWIARFISSLFWLIGAVFLFLIAGRIATVDAAVMATAYFLFVPAGILAGRSFQPDSLMIMMFLLSIVFILRYFEAPSIYRILTAALLSALTLLIRPLVLFTLLGAFTALSIYRKGSWKGVWNSHYLTFVTVSLAPAMAFYLYGVFSGNFLETQARMSFRPDLLLHREFWRGWLLVGSNTTGHIGFIAALVGLPMIRKGLPAALLSGLWAGYAVFGLVFSYHVSFAGYYHLQLIIIVALSFVPLISLIVSQLRRLSNRWYRWIPVACTLIFMFYISQREVKIEAASEKMESEKTAREIGRLVDHSARTIYIARQYGKPLEYYGEIAGSYWFRKGNFGLNSQPGVQNPGIEERLNALSYSPDYFIISDLDEYHRYHGELKEFLGKNSILVAESDRYLIYKLNTE